MPEATVVAREPLAVMLRRVADELPVMRRARAEVETTDEIDLLLPVR